MYFSIILLPLLSFINLFFFGRYIGRSGGIITSIFCISLAWLLNLNLFFYSLYKKDITVVHYYSWFSSGTLDIYFSFLFDSLSMLMVLLVLSISLVVHIYSCDYMSQDPHLQRFMSYLSLFTFFMLLLITSNNLIQLFLGWEGVGLCSYLLISFWYTRLDACKSAIKAVLFNKIGDCALLFGISLIFSLAYSVDYQVAFITIPYFNNSYMDSYLGNISILNVIAVSLVIAAMGKSAQFLLHPWLSQAMEGPTPVSALIHAATMVTAGVFLIMRCSFILEYSFITDFIVFIGTITIFFSSTTALFQYDLKKIIAYSTCSQLGYMFTSCALSGYKASFFHLFTHGFFKALLFLSAGLLIHNLSDEQDIRKMGGLSTVLPITYVFFLIGSIVLMGVPFLSGFFSKDFILELLYSSNNSLNIFCYHVAVLSTLFTTIYSFRLIYFIFILEPVGYKIYYENLPSTESSILNLGCLSVLSVVSITVGYLFKDLFIGAGSDNLFFSIYERGDINVTFSYIEFLVNSFNKILPIIFFISGILVFYYSMQYTSMYFMNIIFYKIYVFFNQAWFINFFYYKINIFYKFTINMFYLDKIILELYGPLLFKTFILYTSRLFLYFENTRTYLHLYIYLLCFIFLFFLF